jgi:hypothetical protein
LKSSFNAFPVLLKGFKLGIPIGTRLYVKRGEFFKGTTDVPVLLFKLQAP